MSSKTIKKSAIKNNSYKDYANDLARDKSILNTNIIRSLEKYQKDLNIDHLEWFFSKLTPLIVNSIVKKFYKSFYINDEVNDYLGIANIEVLQCIKNNILQCIEFAKANNAFSYFYTRCKWAISTYIRRKIQTNGQAVLNNCLISLNDELYNKFYNSTMIQSNPLDERTSSGIYAGHIIEKIKRYVAHSKHFSEIERKVFLWVLYNEFNIKGMSFENYQPKELSKMLSAIRRKIKNAFIGQITELPYQIF